MNRQFRRYHRSIAIALSLPILLTIITGLGYTVFDEWFHQEELAEFLLRLHTLKVLGLETIYPVLNGISLLALLVTGLSMTGLFRGSKSKRSVS